MRSLVVDKLNIAEMTVFNRFDEKFDPQEFHKVVRGVSRRSEIVYEYTDGKVAYDDIEDPLPFDVEADEITRHIMTCCVEDIQYCWLVAQYEGSDRAEESRTG